MCVGAEMFPGDRKINTSHSAAAAAQGDQPGPGDERPPPARTRARVPLNGIAY